MQHSFFFFFFFTLLTLNKSFAVIGLTLAVARRSDVDGLGPFFFRCGISFSRFVANSESIDSHASRVAFASGHSRTG